VAITATSDDRVLVDADIVDAELVEE